MFYIQNQDGKVLQYMSSDGNVDKKSTKVGLPAGTYILRVKNTDYCKNLYINVPYQISANFTKSELYEKEFNDNNDEPNKISLGSQYFGRLSSRDDQDFYLFVLNSKGNVEIRFNHNKLSGVTDALWNVNIINSTGKTINTIKSNGNEDKKVLILKNLPKGSYFIQVTKKQC